MPVRVWWADERWESGRPGRSTTDAPEGPMTSPPTPPAEGPPSPVAPATQPGPQWTAPPAPSWTQPWEPPAPPAAGPVPGVPHAGPTKPRGRLLLALASVVGVLVGAVGGGLLVAMLFVGSAEDIGREIGTAMAPAIRDGISDGMADSMEQSMEDAMALAEEGILAEGLGVEPVQEFPPAEPAGLGEDAVLDAFAADCFAGDLQACDDLYHRSPPMSEYETYALTCGGRVKEYAVAACSELG